MQLGCTIVRCGQPVPTKFQATAREGIGCCIRCTLKFRLAMQMLPEVVSEDEEYHKHTIDTKQFVVCRVCLGLLNYLLSSREVVSGSRLYRCTIV